MCDDDDGVVMYVVVVDGDVDNDILVTLDQELVDELEELGYL